jgi:hypothetical protein
MFSLSLAMSDAYRLEVANDRLREAEHERLVALIPGRSRTVRARVAGWMFALARCIEGQPARQLLATEPDLTVGCLPV